MGDAPKTERLDQRHALAAFIREHLDDEPVDALDLDIAADVIRWFSDHGWAALAAHDTPPAAEELEGDLLYMLKVRNKVAEIAAAEVHPGPDGEDYLIRERIVQRWLDEARDEVDTDARHPLPERPPSSLPPGRTASIRVGGRSFRCDCGCNVFTKRSRVYTCNACGTQYSAEGGQLDPADAATVAEFGVTQPELDVINDEVQAEAELDDLLARADSRAGAENRSTYPDLDAPLIRDLASALRRKRNDNAKWSDAYAHAAARADRLERELAEARSGLQHINRHGCEHNTRGSCLTDPSRSRDAEYGAEQWCDPCIAADALGKKENSR